LQASSAGRLQRLRARALFATVLAVALSACGDDVTEPEEEELPANAPVVFMPGFSFSPFTTTILAGGSVVFDFPAESHNVIFDRITGAPQDIQATTNRRVARQFGTRGNFPYDCTLHPGMSGVVVVQ
jgi:plastocyanin